MNKRELLEAFAEHCHTFYKGSVLENREHFYQYSTEVVCMIDSFLESLEAADEIEKT